MNSSRDLFKAFFRNWYKDFSKDPPRFVIEIPPVILQGICFEIPHMISQDMLSRIHSKSAPENPSAVQQWNYNGVTLRYLKNIPPGK